MNHNTLAFIRRANIALDKWFTESDQLHSGHFRFLYSNTPLTSNSEQSMDENSLLLKILAGDAAYAKVWLVCVALRGVSWDKMPFEQRELAFQAKDAAQNCLHIFLSSQEYR